MPYNANSSVFSNNSRGYQSLPNPRRSKRPSPWLWLIILVVLLVIVTMSVIVVFSINQKNVGVAQLHIAQVLNTNTPGYMNIQVNGVMRSVLNNLTDAPNTNSTPLPTQISSPPLYMVVSQLFISTMQSFPALAAVKLDTSSWLGSNAGMIMPPDSSNTTAQTNTQSAPVLYMESKNDAAVQNTIEAQFANWKTLDPSVIEKSVGTTYQYTGKTVAIALMPGLVLVGTPVAINSTVTSTTSDSLMNSDAKYQELSAKLPASADFYVYLNKPLWQKLTQSSYVASVISSVIGHVTSLLRAPYVVAAESGAPFLAVLSLFTNVIARIADKTDGLAIGFTVSSTEVKMTLVMANQTLISSSTTITSPEATLNALPPTSIFVLMGSNARELFRGLTSSDIIGTVLSGAIQHGLSLDSSATDWLGRTYALAAVPTENGYSGFLGFPLNLLVMVDEQDNQTAIAHVDASAKQFGSVLEFRPQPGSTGVVYAIQGVHVAVLSQSFSEPIPKLSAVDRFLVLSTGTGTDTIQNALQNPGSGLGNGPVFQSTSSNSADPNVVSSEVLFYLNTQEISNYFAQQSGYPLANLISQLSGLTQRVFVQAVLVP